MDALRSGKYKQGDGQLKIKSDPYDVRHCCLGVLCEVAEAEGIPFYFRSEDSYLPNEVMAWVGLKSRQAHYRARIAGENSEGGSLVSMNDTGSSFAEIAAFIEEHAEELGVSA